MPLILHPHVVDLLNAADDLIDGQDDGDAFHAALSQLKDTHNAQRERFDYFKQGQKHTTDLDELRRALDEAFTERAQALDDLEASLVAEDLTTLADHVTTLQKASQRITIASQALETEDNQHRLSTVALVHDFLQAGFNVYGDYEHPSILDARVGPLVAWVRDVESDWESECELFDTLHQHREAFAQALDQIKSGVGAIVTYRDEGAPSDLLAGLVQIQESGVKLVSLIGQAQQEASDLASYSNVREIERFAVRTSRLGAEAPATIAAHQALADLFERQHQKLTNLSEVPFHSEDYAEALAQAEQAWSLQQDALLTRDIEALSDASLAFQASLERLGTLLEEASADLHEAPALEELRKAILGVYYHQVPRRFLFELIEAIEPGFRHNLEAETEDDAREALEACLQAMELAHAGLVEGSADALADAWKLLNHGGSLLISIQHRRIEQASAEADAHKVTCPRCGTRQDPSPLCIECEAKLPRHELGLTTSSLHLSEGESSQGRPPILDQLLELIHRIRSGIAGTQEIDDVIRPLKSKAELVLKQATQGGAEAVYLSHLQTFLDGLRLVAGQAQEKNVDKLDQGAHMLTASAEKILTYGESSAGSSSS